MKKNERLFWAIGDVDLKYVIEAMPKRRIMRPIIFTAGGVCAAALVGFLLLRNGTALIDDKIDVQPPESTTVSDIDNNEHAYPFRYDGREPQILSFDTERYMGAMGGGALSGSVPESMNPWDNSSGITELPVFVGNKRYMMFSAGDVIPKLEKIAEALGEELTDIEYDAEQNPEYFPPEDRDWIVGKTTTLSAKAGDVKLSAHGGGNGGHINVYFPKEREPYTLDEIAELLGFNDPVREEHDISEDFGYTYVFERSDDPLTAIMNYNFRYFDYRVIPGEVNNLFITDTLDTLECVGFYPLMTEDEAREMLKNGEYTAMYYDWEENADFNDVKISLSYSPCMDGSYILPYYDCYVKTSDEGGEGYAYCAVCAIAPEYIDGSVDKRFN